VICTASVEDRVPPFLRNSGKGWVTAEYGMLPRATSTRTRARRRRARSAAARRKFQRLIGRSLRSVTKLQALGERTIWIDCDVIQADGGTRTASITGAFVALALACEKLRERDRPRHSDFRLRRRDQRRHRRRRALLDLAYDDDSRAEVDMNIVKTGDGRSSRCRARRKRCPSAATRSTCCSTSPIAGDSVS
jgi:ribonuclease PH